MEYKPETKKCQNCKKEFTIESEDFKFYEKIKVPPPTFCAECREQRRIAVRNERALYKRKCDLCGAAVVTRVSPDKPYPMYCNKCWWGDGWDPLQYGRDYDFSRPFFEQFNELVLQTPHPALGASNNVNSEWVNQETDDKNCYLAVGGHFNEDCAYTTYSLWGRDNFDSFWVLNSSLCYESINCERCYRTIFSTDCFDSQDMTLSLDCRNCHDCFGCAGLRNKSYHIFNEAYSKKDYEGFLKENPISSRFRLAPLKERADKIWLSIPRRDRFAIKCTDVSGDHITESKNAHNIWNGEKMENCKHFYIAAGMKDSYDGTSLGWSELSYEGAHAVGVYQGKFFAYSFGGKAESRQSSNLEYCLHVGMSNNCFGCVSLRGKDYCILNKRYSKEEYGKLVPRIREQVMKVPYQGKNGRIYRYGEFFPIEISPFGYNETAAMDYYPLTREEALAKGYPWSDYESETKYEFSDYAIPDDIRDVGDGILEKVLKCEVSGKAYKIIPMELQFYRRMGLPLPRQAPLQRHKDRMAKILPRRLHERACECAGNGANSKGYKNTIIHQHGAGECGEKIMTPYSPERPEVVYCEKCYQAEIS